MGMILVNIVQLVNVEKKENGKRIFVCISTTLHLAIDRWGKKRDTNHHGKDKEIEKKDRNRGHGKIGRD